MDYQNFSRGNQNSALLDLVRRVYQNNHPGYYNNYSGYPEGQIYLGQNAYGQNNNAHAGQHLSSIIYQGQNAYGQNNNAYAGQHYNGYNNTTNRNYTFPYNLGTYPPYPGSGNNGRNNDSSGSGNDPLASTLTPHNWWHSLVPRQKWLKSSLDKPPGDPSMDLETITQFCPPQKLSALHQIADHWAVNDGKPKFVTKSLYWYTDDIVELVDDGIPTPIPVLHPGVDDHFSAMDPTNAVFYGDDGLLIPYGMPGYTSNTITVKNMDKVESITFSIYGFYPSMVNIPTVFEVVKSGTNSVFAKTESDTNVSAYSLDRPVVIKTYTRPEIMENRELFNNNHFNGANEITFEFRLRRLADSLPDPNSRIMPRAHLRRAKGTVGVEVTYKVEDLPK